MTLQTPTEADIRARLELMLAEIPEFVTVITTEDDDLTPEQLPAVRVYAGRAQRSRERGMQLRSVTRDWYLVCLFQRVGGSTGAAWTAANKRAEEVACEQFLEIIADWFARHPKLMLDSSRQQMSGVERVDEARDNGLQTVNFGKNGAVYWGQVNELPITINRK